MATAIWNNVVAYAANWAISNEMVFDSFDSRNTAFFGIFFSDREKHLCLA